MQGGFAMADNEGFAETGDIAEQLAGLRAQVEQLTNERIRPAVADAANQVKVQADALADRIREQPIAAVFIAAGIGFLIGRAVR
jgi:ElaB/YqjD/DUF883 family membrane-anchored ribosome-binding protein